MWKRWLRHGAVILASALSLFVWPLGLAARAPSATITPRAMLASSATGTRKLVTATAFVTRIVTQTPLATQTMAPTEQPVEPTRVPAETQTPSGQPTGAGTVAPTPSTEEVEIAPGELPVTGTVTLATAAAGLAPIAVLALLALPALRRRH
jgi:hypothetical protein